MRSVVVFVPGRRIVIRPSRLVPTSELVPLFARILTCIGGRGHYGQVTYEGRNGEDAVLEMENIREAYLFHGQRDDSDSITFRLFWVWRDEVGRPVSEDHAILSPCRKPELLDLLAVIRNSWSRLRAPPVELPPESEETLELRLLVQGTEKPLEVTDRVRPSGT